MSLILLLWSSLSSGIHRIHDLRLYFQASVPYNMLNFNRAVHLLLISMYLLVTYHCTIQERHSDAPNNNNNRAVLGGCMNKRRRRNDQPQEHPIMPFISSSSPHLAPFFLSPSFLPFTRFPRLRDSDKWNTDCKKRKRKRKENPSRPPFPSFPFLSLPIHFVSL